MRILEDNAFLLLIIAVSLAFAWILLPFYGAFLWATVLATVFAPLHQRVLGPMKQRRNLAALVTVLIIVTIVIVPLMLVAASLLQEATSLYERIQSREFDFGQVFQRFREALPLWATNLLDRFGLTDLRGVMERLTTGLMKGSQFLAAQALNIGQHTVDFIVSLFVMLYLLFFLLRDGEALSARIRNAIPLRPEQQHALFSNFTTVIRATVKGDILVAILQGTLGGIIFWALGIYAPVLWAVVMAFLSLLPAVGAALVWLPVATYLLVTGDIWKGTVLIVYGALVIGLVDNVVRPFLVGRDTKMPDYVVLISTLGGVASFGLNGFVIGPMIAAIFIAAWEIFSASKQTAPKQPRQ